MPRWHTSPVPLTKRHFYHELQSHDYSLCKKFRCHEEGSQPPIVRREEGSQPPVCTAVDRATLRKSGIKVGLPHPAESPFRQPNLLHSATESDSTDHSRWYNPGFSFWCVVSEDTKVWLQFSRFLAYATKFPSLHLPMQPSYLPVLRSLLKVSALGNLWKAYLPFHALASAALFFFVFVLVDIQACACVTRFDRIILPSCGLSPAALSTVWAVGTVFSEVMRTVQSPWSLSDLFFFVT